MDLGGFIWMEREALRVSGEWVPAAAVAEAAGAVVVLVEFRRGGAGGG